jgi:hypothetical protein
MQFIIDHIVEMTKIVVRHSFNVHAEIAETDID